MISEKERLRSSNHFHVEMMKNVWVGYRFCFIAVFFSIL